MKRIILLCFFAVSIATVKSQSDLPYKPLSSFKKDTIAYIMYNFETRADFYRDKSVAEIVKDIEIPIVCYRYRFKFKSPKYHLLLFFNSNTDVSSESSYNVCLSSDIKYADYISWYGKWTKEVSSSIKSVEVKLVSVSVPRDSKHYKKWKERQDRNVKEKPLPEIIFKDEPSHPDWERGLKELQK